MAATLNGFKSITIEMEDGSQMLLGPSQVLSYQISMGAAGMCTPSRSGIYRPQHLLSLEILSEDLRIVSGPSEPTRILEDGPRLLPEDWPRLPVPVEVKR